MNDKYAKLAADVVGNVFGHVHDEVILDRFRDVVASTLREVAAEAKAEAYEDAKAAVRKLCDRKENTMDNGPTEESRVISAVGFCSCVECLCAIDRHKAAALRTNEPG